MKANAFSELACLGENLAAGFLVRQGFVIIERNYYSTYGEIDIVARYQNEIVIVEVKTRSDGNVKTAQNSITISKQKRLTLSAMQFLAAHPEYSDMNCRFDAVLVLYRKSDASSRILHFPNAFYPIYPQAE